MKILHIGDWMMKYIKLFAPVLVAMIIFILPTPDGLSQNTWLYFSIFIGIVVGLILEPIPAALVGLVGVGICIWFKIGPAGNGDITKVIKSDETVSWGLAGFSNSTI